MEMETREVIRCVVVVVLVYVCSASEDSMEPTCYSNFDFQEKLLSKMVRLEHKFELMKEKVDGQTEQVSTQLSGFSESMKLIQTRTDDKFVEMDRKAHDVNVKQHNASAELLDQMTRQMNEFRRQTNSKVEDLASKVNQESVMFSVRNPSNRDVLQGQKLLYQTVEQNLGDKYDSSTGIFTAPVDGLYVFTVQIALHGSSGHRIGLKIVTEEVVLGQGHSLYQQSYMTPSITGFGSLAAGDSVWVECLYRNPTSGPILTTDSLIYGYINSFKGVLIH